MSMDFELKLDGKTMSRFLLHYNYTKATGLFGILLGIASLAAVFIKWNMWNANWGSGCSGGSRRKGGQ